MAFLPVVMDPEDFLYRHQCELIFRRLHKSGIVVWHVSNPDFRTGYEITWSEIGKDVSWLTWELALVNGYLVRPGEKFIDFSPVVYRSDRWKRVAKVAVGNGAPFTKNEQRVFFHLCVNDIEALRYCASELDSIA